MMNRIQTWAMTLAAALLTLVGAYAWGGRVAKKAVRRDYEHDEALREAAVAKEVNDVRHTASITAASAKRDDLRDNWVRDE